MIVNSKGRKSVPLECVAVNDITWFLQNRIYLYEFQKNYIQSDIS